MGAGPERTFGKNDLRWRSFQKDAPRNNWKTGKNDLGPTNSDRGCSQIHSLYRPGRCPVFPGHLILSPNFTTGRRIWPVIFQGASECFAYNSLYVSEYLYWAQISYVCASPSKWSENMIHRSSLI
jgi:hypothetical protein